MSGDISGFGAEPRHKIVEVPEGLIAPVFR